ncbi:MAG: hypothetical protein ACI4WY_02075 [Anaerovoracaceae bacterium]
MYYGKHASSETRILPESTAKRSRRLRWKKQFVILAAVIVLILGVVGGTTAYLVATSEPAENTFQYDTVSCSITEDPFTDYSSTVKSNVKVQNTGTTPAYIRAAIVVTWQDRNGNVAPVAPAATDYTISFGEGWEKSNSDGYYYYPSAVASGEQTTNLIDRCTPLTAGPDGYTLHVEILADAIQSSPAAAAAEAWGVTVAENGTISK